jgi:membrane associated rhomboid family serine protease
MLRCYRHPDRETLVQCSNCERPICTSCMTTAAVGIRCPECAGGTRTAPRRGGAGGWARPAGQGGLTVTAVLIALNVLVFLAEMFQGVAVRGIAGSSVIADGGVRAPEVADGEWWRMVTAGFIHAGLFHILFNMFALYVLGSALEQYVGGLRMAVVWFGAVLWGSVGAMLLDPTALTVGASGGVFGLMGALLVVSRQRGMEFLTGGLGAVLLLNLVITFAIPGISIGGHLGGLAGGAAAAFALSGFGRGHIAYGRWTAPVVAGCAAVLAGGLAVGVLVANAAV